MPEVMVIGNAIIVSLLIYSATHLGQAL